MGKRNPPSLRRQDNNRRARTPASLKRQNPSRGRNIRRRSNSRIKNKKLISFLVIVLLCFIAVAAFLTISPVVLGDNVDYGSDNVSIAVTGDVMFGRKMPGVLSSGESPFRYVTLKTLLQPHQMRLKEMFHSRRILHIFLFLLVPMR